MKIKLVKGKKDLEEFYKIGKRVYKYFTYHRSTEDDVMRLIIEGPTAFHTHARVHSFLILENSKTIGRFTLIWDRNLADWVQVSFFEALPGIPNLADNILKQAQRSYPECKQIVVGLNGHLNYGAGILLNRFNEPPVFGLPYTLSYYPYYFKALKTRTMVSFRFETEKFYQYKKKIEKKFDFSGITVRTMDKNRLRREIGIYTYLNNAGFDQHPFWSNRNLDEDYELFYPFRFFLKEENLLFAEYKGRPIGFLLWYPDFNQLVKGDRKLGLSHILRYHVANPIKTFRLTEVAVLPEYRKSPAVLAMILGITPLIQKAGYRYGEGGFIFEENKNSMHMAKRYLKRAFDLEIQPYRKYAVFEGRL